MKKAVALLIIAIFLPQQITYAGSITDEITSRLPSVSSLRSSFESGIATARSYVSKASSTYTTASNAYNALKSVTGISISSITASSIPNNPLSAITIPATTYNYLINPSTRGNLGTSYGAANTLQTDFALTVPKRVYDFTGWVDTVSGLNSNLGTKLYQNYGWARSISNAYSGAKGRTESSLKQTYGAGTYNNFIQPTENFVADNAIITGATLGAGSAVGLAGGTLGRLGSVSRIAQPIISRLPQLGRIAEIAGPRVVQGLKYGRQGAGLLLNSRPVLAYSKYILVPAGIAVMGNTLYGYSPFKSAAYSTYTYNQGQITNLMDKISLEQHIKDPGSFNTNNYETAISDLTEAFPGQTATPEGVSRYLSNNKDKYNGVKFNDPEISGQLTKIVQLSNDNGALGNKFNDYEKIFTLFAQANTAGVNWVAGGMNKLGIPYAGEFVKSVGSFTPLTGLSIGASVGADPVQGFRGFANFFTSPVEDIYGLRSGSFLYHLSKFENPLQDYHANYRNIGRGFGNAFILFSGGREVKGAAGSIKAKTGSFLGIESKFDSFLSANPKINNFVSKPWVKPLASNAVLMGPLAAAAFWQGLHNGDVGTPVASAAVLFMPGIIKSNIGSQQKLVSLLSYKEIAVKTPEMDTAFSLLGRMAKENGEDIMDYASTDKKAAFFEHYSDSRPGVTTEYLLTPQLLTAKVGQPVILIPKTSLSMYNSNSGDDKFKEKISKFQNRIKTKLAGDLPKNDLSKKSPIPVKSLFEDQVTTLKSMITSGANDRLAVIRGLGTGKTTALLAYILPYKIGDNLKRGKGTLILTPNDGVTNDVKAVLRGANDVGFNHQEIQKRLGTNVNFPKEITEKKLKIESVTKIEDRLKQEQDFIDKVMNNDVVVMPYELYSSLYHTYLMRPGRMDAAREKVINRIKDSNFLMDEVDLPAFLPSLMMSEGRMYLPDGHPEYNYWQDVAGKSRQIYDKVKYGKVNSNDMKLDKIEGETNAELESRTMAQGQKLLNEQIPGIEELPSPDSSIVRNLVLEVKNNHPEIAYTDREIAEHLAHGAWGYRSYELRNSFTKEEYAVKTETIPAVDIDTYGPKKAINTVKIGGVEGRDIHNFDLHIPAGQQQILEILHGAKLISRPLKGDHVGNAIDALEILGGSIGFTGTVSDTAKPVLEKAGFTKFDYGQVKASDYEAPVINADLSQTVKQVTDGIVNNRGDRLDIDITPNNPLSRLIKKVLISKGVAPVKLAKEGENYKFIEGKYVHIGGRTPEKAAQALLDSLKTEKAPYAIVGTANEIGRGLNFDPAPYLAKDGTKVAVNLIEPELMTATQVNQGAGRIGGKFRFTNIKDKEGNLHNPEKIVRLLMSKDMMRPMPEFEEVLKLDNSQEGVKSLKITEALQDVWNKNERDVVARSGLSSERIDNRIVKSEFKEVDIPTTLDKIKEKDIRNYLVLKGYTTESIVKKGEAYVKEDKLTIKGLRFMQLFKEAEALSDEQHKILDRITALRILNIDNPVQFAIGLTEKGIVELEDYNKRGLTSVICLGRVLKPFNTDISSEEIKRYQDIITSALEQKLEFVEGLINKNKIKIDDNGTKELILKKLGLLRGSLANIQEISRQISDGYAKNKGTVIPTDKLRLKSAYREFENIMTYQDLENISAKLNSPAITDLIPLFILNAGTDEIAKFSAVFNFAKDNNINLAPYNLFELFNLTNENNKTDFLGFIDKNTKNPALKIYAQRLAIFENALAKQMQYFMQFQQLRKGQAKDPKEFERELQEDVDFLKNFNIDPRRDFQLDLAQLRSLSEGKLSDELLLKVYHGLMVPNEEIENIILNEQLKSEELPQVLSEFIRLKKLWGMERAIREIQAKYAPDVVNGAIKEYLTNIEQGKYFRPEHLSAIEGGIVDAVSALAPLINREGAINAAAVMRIGLLKPMIPRDSIEQELSSGGPDDPLNTIAGVPITSFPGVSSVSTVNTAAADINLAATKTETAN